MSSVKVTVNIEVDGEPVKGFPLVRRFEPVDRDSFDATLSTGAGTYAAFPASGQVASIQALLFQAVGDQFDVRLTGVAASQVRLNRGGFILVVDSSGFTGPTVANVSASPGGKATGFLAGT